MSDKGREIPVLDRLNAAMEQIEGGLDGEIDVAALARTAMTSEYHFRRMFSALAGMPLSEYVRRRRLTVAGAEVLAGERTLLDIAVRYGYTSGEAFARAFRAVHGVGPGEARRLGATLSAQPRMSFRLIVEGSSSMRYRVETRDAFTVAGYKKTVPLVHEGMNPDIVNFIKGLGKERIAHLDTLSTGEPAGVLGITDALGDDRSEGTLLDYWHGVVVTDAAAVPSGLETLRVEAGMWAVFDNEGEFPLAVQYLWRDIYTQWFPSNPYRSRPGPSLLRTVLNEDASRAECQLWIPIEPD